RPLGASAIEIELGQQKAVGPSRRRELGADEWTGPTGAHADLIFLLKAEATRHNLVSTKVIESPLVASAFRRKCPHPWNASQSATIFGLALRSSASSACST